MKTISKEAVIMPLLIVCLFGLYSLGRTRLSHSIPDEKRYIQSSREMVEDGDYITPRYHGTLRFQKPIIFYWLIVLSYKIFGVGIYGARFPSIVAGLLNVILIYLLGRDIFDKKVGIFSALVLSTSEIHFTYSRFAVPDMTFILFITASLYLFIKAYRYDIKGNSRFLYMYVPMALAMLTKGPLGFFYPMVVVCVFLILKKDWAVFKELNFPLGVIIFTIISAPWFIAMIALYGDRYLGNVWSLEIMKKLQYFSSGTNGNILLHYFDTALYYIGIGFVRHLPWSAFLPASLVSIPKLTLPKTKDVNGHALIAVWFFTVFIFLVLIWSTESYYVLGFSIPLSLFIGRYFSNIASDSKLSNSTLFKLPFVITIAVYFVALLFWLGFLVYILDEPISPLPFLMLAVPIFMTCAYFGKNKILLPLSFFITAFALLFYFAGYVIPLIDKDPLLDIAEEIKEIIKPGDVIGVASSEVSYHRLNIPLNDYMIIRIDKPGNEYSQENKGKSINDFLSMREKRVFCVITKNDYYEFASEELRNRLNIMDKTFIWKKFHKQNKEYFKMLLSYLREGKKELLRGALKEEIYLVSNY